ncbi:spore coat protein GerQ [Planifilum fimeticola]|jgi:spore germination protein Q|uniref:Spore coat protein GerQ n=1 Tax=Planifilum fimeticola TaxID=201975 RepID=A0A2T0LCN2_9BACL|nr:spore coat protein GerQ [Planifilum fimeticola]PRX39738.1 spore coat protein GerQ [Planifilum fimeticola]
MYWSYPYYGPAGIYGTTSAGISQRETERRFSEEFLQANVGKVVTVYLTFENNPRWPAKSVTGTLRNVGRDYFVIRDRQTGKDNMFLNINVDYFVFETQPATLLGEER